MAEAMVRGMIAQQACRPEEIGCMSGSGKTARTLAEATGIHHVPDMRELVTEAATSILAFKPHQLQSMPPSLADWTAGKCIISVLAGIPIHRLFHQFPMAENIIRAMPNTPSAISQGMTGYSWLKAPELSAERIIEQVLVPLGPAIEVEERLIDAVTGISGSGVAFVFEFVRGLRNAGVIQGIPEDKAHTFAIQTLLGAAMLLKQTGQSPEDLIAQVVSKGGTTEAGLTYLNSEGFEELIHGAVAAATHRSQEISGHFQ